MLHFVHVLWRPAVAVLSHFCSCSFHHPLFPTAPLSRPVLPAGSALCTASPAARPGTHRPLLRLCAAAAGRLLLCRLYRSHWRPPQVAPSGARGGLEKQRGWFAVNKGKKHRDAGQVWEGCSCLALIVLLLTVLRPPCNAPHLLGCRIVMGRIDRRAKLCSICCRAPARVGPRWRWLS